jgi:DNA-binding IclR family transcriptional regulator
MTELTSAIRPLVILEYLSARSGGATLRQIRDDLGLPRSSAWLLVRQLEEGGFIGRGVPNHFVAGARLIRMGLGLYQTATMAGDGRIFLQDLSMTTGLDVYLAIRTGDSVVYADRIFGANSVQIRRRLGEPRPLHASAAGKAFLAYDDGLWERCIAGQTLERFTEHTLTDLGELRAQLNLARARRYVSADSEILMSISSLACMAFNADGSPWAAVVISAHESDLLPRRDEVIAKLVDVSRQLTEARAALEPTR